MLFYLFDNRLFSFLNNQVKYTTELQLYQPCNQTIFRDISDDQALVCDANCNYARCKDGYRIENTKCGTIIRDSYEKKSLFFLFSST